MRLHKLTFAVALVAFASICSTPLFADQVVFDNLNVRSAGTLGNDLGDFLLAQRFADPLWSINILGTGWFTSSSQPFQMRVTMDGTELESVDVALFNDTTGTTLPGTATLSIYTDIFNDGSTNGGFAQYEPGAILGGTLSHSGAFPTSLGLNPDGTPTGVTFLPDSSLTLTPGSNYWVVLSSTGEFAWSYEAVPAQVPEPTPYFVMAVPFVALLASRRMRR